MQRAVPIAACSPHGAVGAFTRVFRRAMAECGGRSRRAAPIRISLRSIRATSCTASGTDVCALFRSRDPGAPHDLAPTHDLRLDETLQALERRIFERQHAEP